MHTPTSRSVGSLVTMPRSRDSQTDLLGTKLDGGRYEVLDPIGAGGVGVVYRGRQAPLGRGVAIKLMRGPYNAHGESVAAFWREARAAALIDHPNVVRLIDFGHDEDQGFFIVMELLDGRRLEQVLAHTPVPPLAWTCRVVADVLAALAAAHDQGVVHQDVKPENVLMHTCIDSDGDEVEVAKLCDFGLAALLKVISEEGEERPGGGGLRGTPAYMAPEQVRGEAVTLATDLYACGVMLFQLATGRLPYEGDNPVAVALRHLDTPAPLPSSIVPDVDPDLEAVILRAMAKQPEDRFGGAREMRAALLAIVNGPREPHDERPLSFAPPCRDDDETRPYTPLRTLPQWALGSEAALAAGVATSVTERLDGPLASQGARATPRADALIPAPEPEPEELVAAALRGSPWVHLAVALCLAAVPGLIWLLAR